MSERWAYTIILTVITIVVWSGWTVYKSFVKEKDVGQYSKMVAPIDEYFYDDLLMKLKTSYDEVLVKQKEIEVKSGPE